MLSVDMWGPLALSTGSGTLGPRDFGGVKPKQVLELLLVERGRAVHKERLADLLWGEALPARVGATLENYVSLIRSSLDRLEPAGRDLVATEPGGYRVPIEAAAVDLDEFDRLLQAAAVAEPTARRELLDRAIALRRAELLADEPYADWTLGLRGQYEERHLQALIDVAEANLGLGDPRTSAARAERALELDPAREQAHLIAMVAHYANGTRDRALHSYERCRAALGEALGVPPLPETADVHLSILNDEDPESLVAQLLGDDAEQAGLPATRYADSSGASIAYQVFGEGPLDVVFMPGFVSHLEAIWEDPAYTAFMRRLASHCRVIVFDKRGTGLSDAVVEWPSTDERADDVLAVMDTAGSRRAVLFGVSEGGPMCALFAANHPQRTAGLIMHASFARLLNSPDYPWGWSADFFEAYLAAFEDFWQTGNGAELVNPSLDSPRYRRWLAHYFRLSASPGMTRRHMRMNAEIDIRPLLGKLHVPTLVLHRAEERWVAVGNSRFLAEQIPGAKLVELPGEDHWPWAGPTEPLLEAVESFLASV